MAKSKKQNKSNEGFRIANLLSPTEVSYARAASRGIKMDLDKDDFDKAKSEYRETELADISFVNSYIGNVKPLEVLSREDRKKADENEAEESDTGESNDR